MRFALDHMQRGDSGAEKEPTNERTRLSDETFGSVCLRLTSRHIDQPRREMTVKLSKDVIDAY